MLYFDRIDIFEGIDVNKTRESNKCIICYNWYFLDKGFKSQPYICNGCHDVLMSVGLTILLFETFTDLIILYYYQNYQK